MRDKGLVFEEMRRQRRAMGGPIVDEWIFWVVVVAALYLVASFAYVRARSGRERSEVDLRPSDVAASVGLVRRDGRVAGSGR